jgi:hypothetical protein
MIKKITKTIKKGFKMERETMGLRVKLIIISKE